MVVAVGCESDCGGDEVYPATFGNEEKTGLKLDDGVGVAKTINFSYTITLYTCLIYVGFRPTVLGSSFCITIKLLVS